MAHAVAAWKPPITTRLERVGPQEAEAFLVANIKNRPVREALIATLSEQIKTGRWKLTGDTIKISSSGRLLDGQHRLRAIVASGATVELLVVRGVNDDAFDCIDCGRKRSVADSLAIGGEQDCNNLVGALNWILRYKPGARPNTSTFHATIIEEALREHPGIRHSLHLSRKGNAKLVSVSMLAALHYIFARLDPELALVFVNGMNSGYDRTKYSTFHALREKLLLNKLSRKKMRQEDIVCLCMLAWNKTRVGLSTTRIHLTEDMVFPELR